MLSAHNGAVMLYYVHHARVYAWRGPKGVIEFGMLRIFTGELGRMGLRKKGIDVFSHPIPIWSESYRLSEPKLIRHVEDGTARQIGWLVDGDEFAFQSDARLPGRGASEIFSEQFADRRWTLNGFPDPSKLRLRPTYLSSEELPDEMTREVSEIISGQGWRPSLSVALSQEPMRVIRRTILGSPRWKGEFLPTSWSPLDIARRMLS
jgi:CRISPR-associated endonuclease Csn1